MAEPSKPRRIQGEIPLYLKYTLPGSPLIPTRRLTAEKPPGLPVGQPCLCCGGCCEADFCSLMDRPPPPIIPSKIVRRDLFGPTPTPDEDENDCGDSSFENKPKPRKIRRMNDCSCIKSNEESDSEDSEDEYSEDEDEESEDEDEESENEDKDSDNEESEEEDEESKPKQAVSNGKGLLESFKMEDDFPVFDCILMSEEAKNKMTVRCMNQKEANWASTRWFGYIVNSMNVEMASLRRSVDDIKERVHQFRFYVQLFFGMLLPLGFFWLMVTLLDDPPQPIPPVLPKAVEESWFYYIGKRLNPFRWFQ